MSLALHKTADGGSQWPPGWNTMPHGISVGRYIDPGFAQLEDEKLWSRVWQVAARLDEIPAPGDFTVYEIGRRSVLLVRVDAETVKAYHNFCPHRGTALGEGCGSFEKGRIVCPFHGWRWDLAGKNQLVLEKQEFRGGKLQDADVALREVRSVVFAGFVFITFAANPEPFDEFIAPVRQWIEDFAIADMHHYWWKSIPVPANWKVAQEAFFEAYHVSGTHPQLDKVGREIVYGDRKEGHISHNNVSYDALPKGHGRFYAGRKSPIQGHLQEPTGDMLEAMIARLTLIAEGVDAMVLEQVLLNWQRRLVGPVQDALVIIDGKKMRHGGVEMVNATNGNGQYLGGMITQAKSNEIPAARQVLSRLDLAGKIVLADALHTQVDTAQQILFEQGGDFLLTVKGNQPTLQATLQKLFEPQAFSPSGHATHTGDAARAQSGQIGNSVSAVPGSEPKPSGLSRCQTGSAPGDPSQTRGQMDPRSGLPVEQSEPGGVAGSGNAPT